MNIVEQWKNTVLKNYQSKNSVLDSELELVLSYLNTNPKKLTLRTSYPDVFKKADKWKNRTDTTQGRVRVIHTFDSGYTWVELLDSKAKEYEGEMMGNCINGDHFNNYSIYSLRNANNIPCVDLQVEESEVCEIKGKSNTLVKEKYIPYVETLLDILNVKLCDEYLYTSSFGLTEISDSDIEKLDNLFSGFKIKKMFNSKFITGELKLKKNQEANLAKALSVPNYDFYSYLETFAGLTVIKKLVKIMWENQGNTTDFIHLAACNKNQTVIDYCFKIIDKIRTAKKEKISIGKIEYSKKEYSAECLTIEMEECQNGELYETALTNYIAANKDSFSKENLYQLFTGLSGLYKTQQIYNILNQCNYDVNEFIKSAKFNDWVEEKSFVNAFLRHGLRLELFWEAYEKNKSSQPDILLKLIDLNPKLFKKEYLDMIDEDDSDEYAGKDKTGPKIREKLAKYGIKM